MIHARLFPSPTCKMSFDLKNTGQQLKYASSSMNNNDRMVHSFSLSLIETDLVDKKQTEAISSLDADATAIVFITDCSDYDPITTEKGCQNRLQQSLDRFKRIQNNKLDHSLDEKCITVCSLFIEASEQYLLCYCSINKICWQRKSKLMVLDSVTIFQTLLTTRFQKSTPVRNQQRRISR